MRLTAAILVFTIAMLASSSALAEDSAALERHVRDGLPNVAKKLEDGKTVRVAYIGGSITCQNGYRPKSLAWLRERYPNATIEEIFAGIGGTPSRLGVYRLQQDVLRHDPDVIFVEFAVNDSGNGAEESIRSMEGITRQTWALDPTIDLVFVYTLTGAMFEDLRAGQYQKAAQAHELVAEHYGAPSIHLGVEIAKLEGEGKLIVQGDRPPRDVDALAQEPIVFSGDGVHPYEETGHELYMQALARSLPPCLAGEPGPHRIPAPLRDDNRESAHVERLTPEMQSAGWRRLPEDDTLAKRFRSYLPELWVAEPGETLTIRFRGTAIGFYDLLTPDSGQLQVTLDGKDLGLRRRFDSYCVYSRIGSLFLADGLEDGEHVLEVTVSDESFDKMAILSPQRRDSLQDKSILDGKRWYVGGILIEGEIAPTDK